VKVKEDEADSHDSLRASSLRATSTLPLMRKERRRKTALLLWTVHQRRNPRSRSDRQSPPPTPCKVSVLSQSGCTLRAYRGTKPSTGLRTFCIGFGPESRATMSLCVGGTSPPARSGRRERSIGGLARRLGSRRENYGPPAAARLGTGGRDDDGFERARDLFFLQ